MKKYIRLMFIIIMMILSNQTIKAQVTTPNNFGFVGDYVGWQTGQYLPLNINNQDAYPINFLTSNTQRAIINSSGLFGIGKINPGYQLTVAQHIDIDTNIVYPTLSSPIGCYMLNDTTILHNYGIENLFCGLLSGVSITSGYSNAFFGKNAGRNDASGYYNTFLGDSAGFSNTLGISNTFVGHSAGYSTMGAVGDVEARPFGQRNTFVGDIAGYANDSGYQNTFLGYNAGISNIGGHYNVFVGDYAGYSNIGIAINGSGAVDSGDANVFVGSYTGFNNTMGVYNTMTGHRAGHTNITGSYNVFYGKECGAANVDGFWNAFYGADCGSNMQIDYYSFTSQNQYNSFFGGNAGFTCNGGTHDLYLGYGAQSLSLAIPSSAQENNLSWAIAIGANVIVPFSHQVVIGDSLQNVGIGLSGDYTLAGNDGPQKPLEINAGKYPNAQGYNFGSPPGVNVSAAYSGLRLRDMTSNCKTETANPGPGVLSVNSSGDVIYVPVTSGADFGYCSPGPLPALSGDAGINLNDYNFLFEPDSSGGGKVGIGYNCSSSLPGKLSVNVTTLDESGNTKGVDVNVDVPPSVLWRTIYGENISASCTANYNSNVYGIYSASNNGDQSIGVYGKANGASFQNIGVKGITTGGASINYGIYGSVPVSDCPGPSACSNAAGYFNGDVFVTSPHLYVSSDSTLKDSIQTLTNAMAIINQLYPKTFVFKTDSFPTMNLPTGQQYGLISQQVATVLPGLVKNFAAPQPEDSLGNIDTTAAIVNIKALDYTGLIPFVVEGEKELGLSIDSLRTGEDSLSNEIGYGLISLAPTTLSGNIGMKLNGHNIYYDGQDTSINSGSLNSALGIGYVGGDTLPAKLSVSEHIPGVNVTVPTTAGYFHNGDSIVSSSGINETGITSIADGTHITTGGQGLNIGGYFEAENSNTGNVALYAQSGSESQSSTIGYGGIILTNGSYSLGENGIINMIAVDSANTVGVLDGLTTFEPIIGSVGTLTGITNNAVIEGNVSGDATGISSDLGSFGTIGGNAYGVSTDVAGNVSGNATGVLASMSGTIGGNLNGVDIEMPQGEEGGGGLLQSIRAGGGADNFLQQTFQTIGGIGSNLFQQSLSSGGGLGGPTDTALGVLNGVYMNINAYAAGGFNGENINISGNTPSTTTGDNVNLNTNTSYGSYGLNQNIYDGGADAYGIYSYVQSGQGDAYGPVFNVNGSADSYGGQFYAYGAPGDNVGLAGYSDGSGSGSNYGVYGSAPVGSCDSGSCTEAAGFFDGDLAYTGTSYQVSDAAMKDSIQPLQNAMAILNKLNAKTYTFKKNDYPTVNLPSGSQNGFIAQEVETVLPGLVKSFKVLAPPDTSKHATSALKDGSKSTNATGLNAASSAQNKAKNEVQVKALNYTGLIPLLVQGMKEQEQTMDSLKTNQQQTVDSLSNLATQQQITNQNMQHTLDSLRNMLNQLQSVISNCCAQNQQKSGSTGSSTLSNSSVINVDLSNAIILNQNDPNPFAEHTTITFNIPDEVQSAQIVFFDNVGRIIKTIIVSDRGPGTLDVYAGNLSSGIYSYSLLADGKLIDTKKMVCTK